MFSLAIASLIKREFKLKKLVVFLSLYLLSTLLIVPLIAPKFGRERIKSDTPASYFTILANRNYVIPEMNVLLKDLQDKLGHVNYLDANFPFIDKFPLLPNLNHNDGKKLDLSLAYETSDGSISAKQKSRSGYGVFEGPKGNEQNQIAKCKDAGYFQYDYPKYLTFGRINNDLQFSEKGTRILIETILKSDIIEKVFIEPHLKNRMGIKHPKIRYHGCGSVRHDDHIHIQLK